MASVLYACSDGGGGDVYGVSGCSTVEQNEIVHRALQDRYYWYEQIPDQVNYAGFESPSQMLASLRYDGFDRFSYITSQSSFSNLFNDGTYVGYGFGFDIDAGGKAFVRLVYNQSPAATVGMARGDELLSVNNESVSAIIAADRFGVIFGAAEIGLPVTIKLAKKSGGTVTLSILKSTVKINTVLHSEVIASGSTKIGYLVFNSFLNTSVAEFTPVFGQFKAAGVSRLILDLRYNGGGSINVARELASYIKQTSDNSSDLYVKLVYNDKHQQDNFNYFFQSRSASLGLDQLTVITSAATCSASEQIISALHPYFGAGQVTTVGSATCGKPVGMNPLDFCGQTMLAVNFASFNRDNQGNYFSGIPASCSAGDDTQFDFGDLNEPMLAAAKYHVDNLSCPAAKHSRRDGVSDSLRGIQAVIGAV
ncbi:MAG: carboxyl-terminal processing protease [Gammaproteobacteria bacterium]|jgi:carboxyl-terminal processing protease